MRLPCAYPSTCKNALLGPHRRGPSRTSGLTTDGRPGEDREQRLTFNVERKERHRIGVLMPRLAEIWTGGRSSAETKNSLRLTAAVLARERTRAQH